MAKRVDPGGISLLILTHCHIDHSGGPYFREIPAPGWPFTISTRTPSNRGPGPDGGPLVRHGIPPDPGGSQVHGIPRGAPVRREELHVLHTPGHTPGSVFPVPGPGGKRILFDRTFTALSFRRFGSNLDDWRVSMEKLLDLKADILCEGHFGIFPDRRRWKGT